MKPLAENVTGEVRHTHRFSHSIRWEYVIGLLVALYALKVLHESIDGDTSENEERGGTAGTSSDSSDVGDFVSIGLGGGMGQNQVTADEQGGI